MMSKIVSNVRKVKKVGIRTRKINLMIFWMPYFRRRRLDQYTRFELNTDQFHKIIFINLSKIRNSMKKVEAITGGPSSLASKCIH